MKKKIAVWTTDYSGINGQSVVTRFVVENIVAASPHVVFTNYSSVSFYTIFTWLRNTLLLWVGIVRGSVGTIYLVCSRSGIGFLRDIPALAASRFGIKVVVHIHGTDFVDLLQRRKYSWLAKWFYRRTNLLVPSQHLLEVLTDKFAGITLCENFCSDQSHVNRISKEYTDKLIVIWNSNIMASKGFFDVCHAIEELVENYPEINIELLCMGTPIPDSELSAEDVQCYFNIFSSKYWFTRLGSVQPSKTWDYLIEGDVVALPSRYSSECQPLAIIQAMCAGKEIVVADSPALRATVGTYPACFVETKSIQALAECFLKLHSKKHKMHEEFFNTNNSSAEEAKIRFSTGRFSRDVKSALGMNKVTYVDSPCVNNKIT